MKILFLDFDGVLNSLDNMEANYYLWRNNPEYKSKDRFGDLFDERCVSWLKYIVMKTDCKLVISSTWKLAGFLTMQQMWEERKLPGIIIDTTPNLTDTIRGIEIHEWMILNSNDSVTSYCIVDDNNDMLENQPLVQVNSQYGLNKETAIQVISILNK